MPKKFFKLNISPTDYQAYYRGQSQVVMAHSEDGHRLQFPAIELRKFVSHTGVHGRFEITFTSESKLVNLRKVD